MNGASVTKSKKIEYNENKGTKTQNVALIHDIFCP